MTRDGHPTVAQRISSALDEIRETSPHQTDGKWLERMTAEYAPLIAEWDISDAWLWMEWPDRQTQCPPNTPEIGIDIVAKRASDGRFVAIQCKSRKLDEHGRGLDITKDEFNSFLSFSSDELWAERWLVVIGDTRLVSHHHCVDG